MRVRNLSIKEVRVEVQVNGIPATLRKSMVKAIRLVFNAESPGAAWEISIANVNDATIRNLNRTYRHKDKVTDILSFRYGQDHGEKIKRGELVVNLREAMRRSRLGGTAPLEYVSWLMVHGSLHILGYHHAGIASAAMMKKKEGKYLKKLSV